MMDNGKLSDTSKKPWHRWFGNLFKVSLIPLGVEVHTDYPVMTEPPRADIIILKKKQREWTPEQLKFLPDGIRESSASRIIIEFKYTESVNEEVLFLTGAYRVFFKQYSGLKDEDVQAFMASARTPPDSIRKKFGYLSEERSGVFVSSYPLVERIPLLSLNDLSDESYNLLFRLFGSKKKKRIEALKKLGYNGIMALPEALRSYVFMLVRFMFDKEVGKTGELNPDLMDELTSEEMAEIVKIMARCLPPEEVLSLDDVLLKYDSYDVLARLKPEEIEAYLQKKD